MDVTPPTVVKLFMPKTKAAKKPATKKPAAPNTGEVLLGMRLVRVNELTRVGVKYLSLLFENPRTKKRARMTVTAKKGEDLPVSIKDAR